MKMGFAKLNIWFLIPTIAIMDNATNHRTVISIHFLQYAFRLHLWEFKK